MGNFYVFLPFTYYTLFLLDAEVCLWSVEHEGLELSLAHLRGGVAMISSGLVLLCFAQRLIAFSILVLSNKYVT